MEKKEVNTPSYWEEEKYQSLTEVKTIFGNTVKIPERFKDSWDFLMQNYEELISRQGRANGLKAITESLGSSTVTRSRDCEDFYKVFAESYQKQS
ncbi:MAG: hypothetical protein IIU77_05270 [Clostridia bacterium]|nr:hypothetical protein [Clostridia bacterium]